MKKIIFIFCAVVLSFSSCSKREPIKENVAPLITKFLSSQDNASVRVDGGNTILRTEYILFEVDAADANGDDLAYTWSAAKAYDTGEVTIGTAGKIAADSSQKIKWYLPESAKKGDYYKISVQVSDIGKNGAPLGTFDKRHKIIEVVDGDIKPSIMNLSISTVEGEQGRVFNSLKFDIIEPDREEAIINYEISYTPPLDRSDAKLLDEDENDIQGKIIEISSPGPDAEESELMKSIRINCPEGDGQCEDKFINFNPSAVGRYTFNVEVKIKNIKTAVEEIISGNTPVTFDKLKLKPARGVWELGSAYISEKIYEFGGRSAADISRTTNTVKVWDLKERKWLTSFDSPPPPPGIQDNAKIASPRASFGYATYQEKIYILGGIGPEKKVGGVVIEEAGAKKTTLVLDTTSRTWAEETPLTAERYGSCAVEAGGNIYLIGGFNKNHQPISSVEKYDTQTKEWTNLSSLSIPRGSLSCAKIGSVIYAIGGITTAGGTAQIVGSVEKMDTFSLSPKWTAASSLNTERAGASAVLLDNKIYIFGGMKKDRGTTNAVEVLKGASWVVYDKMLSEPVYHLTTTSDNSKRIYIISGTKDGASGQTIFEEWLIE